MPGLTPISPSPDPYLPDPYLRSKVVLVLWPGQPVALIGLMAGSLASLGRTVSLMIFDCESRADITLRNAYTCVSVFFSSRQDAGL